MQDFKQYIAKQLVGKHLHFVCDCSARLDFSGTVQSFTLNDDEILFSVLSDKNQKVYTIGSNHPNMNVSDIT